MAESLGGDTDGMNELFNAVISGVTVTGKLAEEWLDQRVPDEKKYLIERAKTIPMFDGGITLIRELFSDDGDRYCIVSYHQMEDESKNGFTLFLFEGVKKDSEKHRVIAESLQQAMGGESVTYEPD